MEITVNQQQFILPDDCNLQALFAHVLPRPHQGIAIAINETIIPKTQWESWKLNSGDKIIIIKATQGG